MSETSPLEVLEQSVLAAKANREAREETLKAVPRWRFRRRRDLEQSLRRRREWEQLLRQDLSSRQQQS